MKIYFAEWNANYEKLMFDSMIKEKKYNIIILNKLMKHFRRINIKLKNKGIKNSWFVKIHHFFKLRHINPDDILVCNGFSVTGFIDLIKNTHCKKILVLRDTIDIVENAMKNKKKWLNQNQSYIKEIIPYFDHVYSFDIDDCKKYNFLYLEQFLPFSFSEVKEIRSKLIIEQKNSLTCFFVGEHWEEREQIINKISPILLLNNCKTDFYLVDYSKKFDIDDIPSENFKKMPITYQENIKKSISADIILEINHKNQSGASLRSIEAILLNKKLITTNINIKNYEFYRPEQIFILDNNYDELAEFLVTPFLPINIDLLFKYTSDGMINKLLIQ